MKDWQKMLSHMFLGGLAAGIFLTRWGVFPKVIFILVAGAAACWVLYGVQKKF